MPLRDHFRPPLDDRTSWDGFHGQWPAMITLELSRKLPRRYVAAPHVPLGSSIGIDVATNEEDEAASPGSGEVGNGGGGVATAVWTPPRPTLTVVTDLPALDEYEVRVYDTKRGRRLVAAVKIVSPANKDRPEHRRAFVAKCAALLQNHVCVAIVDLVTTRTSNLYRDLMELLGQTDPSLADGPPPSMPSPVARPEMGTSGCWRPGHMPWLSADRCRHCRCGSRTTSRCPSSWS